MKIKLNEETYEVESDTTLGTFIKSLDIQLQGIAVAIDYEVIPKDQWDNILLKEDTRIIMIQAVSGG